MDIHANTLLSSNLFLTFVVLEGTLVFNLSYLHELITFVSSFPADIMASTMVAPESLATKDAGRTSTSKLSSRTRPLDDLPVTKIPFLDTIDHYALDSTESRRIASSVLRCYSDVDAHSFVEHITRAYAHFVASFTGQNDVSFIRTTDFISSSSNAKCEAISVSAGGQLGNESMKSFEIGSVTVESNVKLGTQFGLQFSAHNTMENVAKILGSEVRP